MLSHSSQSQLSLFHVYLVAVFLHQHIISVLYFQLTAYMIDAHEILREHTNSTFAMMFQQSIDWIYLVSILVVLDQDDVREK
jgi:hypothetical protein